MSSATPSRATTPVKPRHMRQKSASAQGSPASQLPTPTRQNSTLRRNKKLTHVKSASVDLSSSPRLTRLPTPATLTPPGSPAPSNVSSPLKNRDSIKVIARFRPQFDSEALTTTRASSLRIIDDTSVSIGGEVYTYDRVFGQDSTQEDLFAYSVESTVEDLFAGYNGAVLAYGQTGSGKTFTMMGSSLINEQRGVIPRISDAIFEKVSREQKTQTSSDPTEFTISASYMEIYMEQVRDLLTPKSDLPLVVQEDGTNGVHVRNLTKRYVASSEELYALLEKGALLRAVGRTEMNEESSRSHAIFQLDLTQENLRDGIKRSKLFLVDLAGSEKVGKTGASGQTLEEAKKINSSLSHLGIVINALTDSKSTHIPYRDSKLTRILQQSLGGNSRTSLIVNCSPAAYNEAETLSTLRFGTRAKKIKNKAHVNSEPSQLDLLRQIEMLQMKYSEQELHSKELEFELDLWKSGIKKLETKETPPPPPPKDLPARMSNQEAQKMLFLENRVQDLTALLSRTPTLVSAKEEDTNLAKQLEESQAMNGALLEDLNQKCSHLFEMQQEIDQLTTKLQEPHYEEERIMALEQTLDTFTSTISGLEHQNRMLQKEITTTRSIAETRQERIKTLEELLKDSQSRLHTESTNFEFKLFSLKDRLSSARKLSTSNASISSANSVKLPGPPDAPRCANGSMSKIEENRTMFGGDLPGHKRSESQNQSVNGSQESLISIRRTESRATSVSQRTSSVSSSASGAHMRFGLNLNIIKAPPS